MKEISIRNFYTRERENIKSFGRTYQINSDFGEGYQWVFPIEGDNYITIDHIIFYKDTLLEYQLPSQYLLVLYLAGSGDEFYPYQNLTPNTLRCYSPKEQYKVIYHPHLPLKAVNIHFSPYFIEEYLKEEHFDIHTNFHDFFKHKYKWYDPNLNKVLYDIYHYDSSPEMAKLYLLSKIYEILALISEFAQQVKEDKEPSKEDSLAIEEITRYMDEHYHFPITNETLAKIACMSESKMKKLFIKKHNMSITEYIQRKRIHAGAHLLITSHLSIKEVSRIVGYKNSSRFIELFKRYYGITPGKYR
ncbi:MAG: AraC family transcriptional regulator [Tissierellia bacterium]|nr:AraC family transcriptional regulator [Tissierellia bacterium]